MPCVTAFAKPPCLGPLTLTRHRSRLAGCLLNIVCRLDISHRAGCISFIIHHHKVKWKGCVQSNKPPWGFSVAPLVSEHHLNWNAAADVTALQGDFTSLGNEKKGGVQHRSPQAHAFRLIVLNNIVEDTVCKAGCACAVRHEEVNRFSGLQSCWHLVYRVEIKICVKDNRRTLFESETHLQLWFRKVMGLKPPTDTQLVSSHFLSCFLFQMWPQHVAFTLNENERLQWILRDLKLLWNLIDLKKNVPATDRVATANAGVSGQAAHSKTKWRICVVLKNWSKTCCLFPLI